MYLTAHSRPLLICEHGLNAPPGAKYVKRLGEAVIVNQPGVDRKKPHHQDDVSTVEERHPYLRSTETRPLARTSSHAVKDERNNYKGPTHPDLVVGPLPLLGFFREHHPQGEETHYRPVAEVAKHHSEQEGERDDGVGGCRRETHTFDAIYSDLPPKANEKALGSSIFVRHGGSSYLGLPRDNPPPHTPPRCSESPT